MKRTVIAGLAAILASLFATAPALAQTGETAVMLQNVWKTNIVMGATGSSQGSGKATFEPDLLDLNAMPVVNIFDMSAEARASRDADLEKRGQARITIAPFGSPDAGIFVIMKGANCLLSDAQLILSFVPCRASQPPPGAEWVFESDLSMGGAYKIRKLGTNAYLHIERGYLMAGDIQPGWHSARWRLLASGLDVTNVPGLWHGYKP